MRISEFIIELRNRNKLLYLFGLLNFLLAIVVLIPMIMDSRLVMGINPWIKPLKFCISIGVYLWTFAWILHYLPDSKKWVKAISWVASITMLIEIVIIIYQAARGTHSHFNFESPFDGALFGIMGILVAINTLAIIVTFILFLVKKPEIDPAYLLSIRLAFVIFLVGNWVGSVMISQMAHSVGVVDGGQGIPFTNWSTEGGDYRIAHFLGLHALQILPLLTYLLKKNASFSANSLKYVTIALALAFGGWVGYLYWQAKNGIPLF